ncbi:hypothetical protein GCM10009113_06680 [Marinobacter szutsaonensis]
MRQTTLFGEDVLVTQDMHVLLQLFTNYRGIDIDQDFFGLSHVYHSVYTHPEKLPKSSWSETRVLNAIRKCEEAGLIAQKERCDGWKWKITERGTAARHSAFLIEKAKKRNSRA